MRFFQLSFFCYLGWPFSILSFFHFGRFLYWPFSILVLYELSSVETGLHAENQLPGYPESGLKVTVCGAKTDLLDFKNLLRVFM